MPAKHGTLEGAILTALWDLEERGLKLNTVQNVFDNLETETRAYTTIKTVMDRLCQKKILIREKKGKKFFYKTAFSNYEIVVNSLNEISSKYCSGNINMLFDVLQSMCEKKQLIGV